MYEDVYTPFDTEYYYMMIYDVIYAFIYIVGSFKHV